MERSSDDDDDEVFVLHCFVAETGWPLFHRWHGCFLSHCEFQVLFRRNVAVGCLRLCSFSSATRTFKNWTWQQQNRRNIKTTTLWPTYSWEPTRRWRWWGINWNQSEFSTNFCVEVNCFSRKKKIKNCTFFFSRSDKENKFNADVKLFFCTCVKSTFMIFLEPETAARLMLALLHLLSMYLLNALSLTRTHIDTR